MQLYKDNSLGVPSPVFFEIHGTRNRTFHCWARKHSLRVGKRAFWRPGLVLWSKEPAKRLLINDNLFVSFNIPCDTL